MAPMRGSARATGWWSSSDESDGTFVKLPADIVIVTNIDPEHLDHYGTFDKAKEAFLAFVENIPFYGFAVMCIDHPEVQALIGRVRDRRIITYGRSPQADVRLIDAGLRRRRDAVRGAHYRPAHRHARRTSRDSRLAMPGDHNALNATAAIAVAHELGIGRRRDQQGFQELHRRQAALHAHRRARRRHGVRRLRPSSGRDRRGARRRARRHAAARSSR